LNFWADSTFLDESGFWENFAMTSPETLYKKDVVNKLIFLPVTHATRFDIRFGCYGVLKSEHGAEHFWTEKMVSGFSRFEGIRSVNLSEGVYGFRRSLAQLSNAYSYTHFW
jgi:hypothetical protein